jgi:hypothetical protein
MKFTCLLVLTAPFTLIFGTAISQADLLLPDADAYIERNSPNNNYGNSVQLRVKNNTDNFVRKSYVRFDLSGLSFDHTTDLTSATLSLNFYDIAAGNGGTTNNWDFSVYGLNDGDTGEGWIESGAGGITWNNASQNDTSNGNGMLGGATLLGDFSFVGRTADIDFTGTAIRDFVAASTSDDLVTFVVVRETLQPDANNSYVHAFASKEHTSEQSAQLNLQNIPEPSTLSLIALGIAGLAARARRSELTLRTYRLHVG